MRRQDFLLLFALRLGCGAVDAFAADRRRHSGGFGCQVDRGWLLPRPASRCSTGKNRLTLRLLRIAAHSARDAGDVARCSTFGVYIALESWIDFDALFVRDVLKMPHLRQQ